jgi:pimeloyl-ACP methyl ester carboxylesterase
VLVVALAIIASLAYIVYGITRPPRRSYLVTPDAFKQFSGPVVKVTDESWNNGDGTKARGWLLKGAEGAPAVILLHRYGADRSWLFNLGVKINEQTNFTILWPDLRGHGMDPPISWTSFGGRETQDLAAALGYLRNLKGDSQKKLITDQFGIYGVELGAYTALRVTRAEKQIKSLVLDSLPESPDTLVHAVTVSDLGIDNNLVNSVARGALKLYLMDAYESESSCSLASSVNEQRVLLLSGADAGYLKDSTATVGRCFPNSANLDIRTDLPLSGFNLPMATGEDGEGYDRIVIDFFDRTLR